MHLRAGTEDDTILREQACTYLWTAQILKDSDVLPGFLPDFFYFADGLEMVLVGPMGKIEPGNVEAGLDELFKGFRR